MRGSDHAVAAEHVIGGGGNMGELMRAHDWANTSVGPVAQWPQSLRTALSMLLATGYPMYIAWGPDYTQFYNDAYRPILGSTKHPAALGISTRDTWAEIWDIIGTMFDGVLVHGHTTTRADELLPMDRHGYVEETYFDFSYSPIREEGGNVGGVLVTCNETTGRVLGERRLRTLSELATRVGEAHSAEEACARAALALGDNPYDVPFALCYLLDGEHARLAATVRTPPEGAASAADTTVDTSPWGFRAVLDGRSAVVRMLADIGVAPVQCEPWPEPITTVVSFPIRQAAQDKPVGFLVLGLSARRQFDRHYRNFCELIADQIGAAIADARAYEAERKRAEALEELDRAKTVFFSNVSHEFRTPLTLLLGPLEDALSAAAAGPEREPLEIAHRNALRLHRLVNTLLDFSRIESGRINGAYEATDLAAYTADLASAFRSATERAGLTLTVDCPPLPDGVDVYVDRDMWEKVVLNLLSNAFKFTFSGEITVSLRAADDGKSIHVTVRDTGVGIERDELPMLFDRFHRVRGTRARTQEGSGIGLALVQELVRLHGGTIAVESEPGAGTTFTIELPTGHAHLPADHVVVGGTRDVAAPGARPFVEEALRWLPDPTDSPDPADPRNGSTDTRDNGTTDGDPQPWQSFEEDALPGRAPNDLRDRRVLVIDDNADMRDYVRRLLADRYVVETANDAESALASIDRALPDLVLSDVMLPAMDGFGLLRTLRGRADTETLPVILLSARAGDEAKVEGLDAGADDYLVKPFSARELVARVESHLRLSALRTEARERESTMRAQLEDLLQLMPAAMSVYTGPDLVCTLANGLHNEIVEREVIGLPIRAAFPELDPQLIARMERVYRTGESDHGIGQPVRLRRGSSLETGFFDFTYLPLRDANGKIEAVLSHAYDVTDQVLSRRASERSAATLAARARQQEALLELGQRALSGGPLQELLESACRALSAELETDAAAVLEALPANAGYGLRAGWGWPVDLSAPVIEPAHPLAAQPSNDQPNDQRFVLDGTGDEVPGAAFLRSHGIVAGLHCVIAGAGGAYGLLGCYVRSHSSFDEDEVAFVQSVANLLGIAIERERAERQRARLLEREHSARVAAEEAIGARDAFISITSHELRNPIAAVKGTAQLLRRQKDRGRLDDERFDRHVEALQESSTRLEALTSDLLSVSRVQRGLLELKRRPVELNELVRVVVARQRAAAPHARIDVLLPEEQGTVDIDPDRIDQVLANLLDNAVKYSPGRPHITVTLQPQPEGVEIAVADRGIGIRPDDLGRLFTLFSRAENASAVDVHGLGLGLYISRAIAELHDGRLWAESDGEGTGTTMRLWLPVNRTALVTA